MDSYYSSHMIHIWYGPWVQWRQFPRNFILRLCVVLVVGITLLPVLEWSYSYWERASRFPSLLEFSSEWEMDFVNESASELQVVPAPVGWKKSSEDLVGRVVFHPMKYPGIRLEEPYPDWRGYSSFQLDIFSELSNPQKIGIRIDDAQHNGKYADRFNRPIVVLPGLNHIQIPLDDIRVAPVGREMNLSAIRRVLLFAVSPPEEFILYLDNIHLE